ncbi:MAG: helix-turn-helix domain-containing protein, partial [Lachnospiraceae bacterium]|nr:helix-turn-helix domain-containing protein [Lachnospiraceae bacterium]
MYGKRIIELRRKQGFTQAELAKIIGISRSALSLYEIEKREPDIDTLNRIASAFDVSIDYLLGHTNTKKNDDSKHDYFFFFFDHWTECKKRIRSKMQELFISEQDFQSETNIDIEKEISIE